MKLIQTAKLQMEKLNMEQLNTQLGIQCLVRFLEYQPPFSFPFNKATCRYSDKQENIRTKAKYPLRDRNPNTYNLILGRPQNDLDLEMTMSLR